jgi:hypothetical protein
VSVPDDESRRQPRSAAPAITLAVAELRRRRTNGLLSLSCRIEPKCAKYVPISVNLIAIDQVSAGSTCRIRDGSSARRATPVRAHGTYTSSDVRIRHLIATRLPAIIYRERHCRHAPAVACPFGDLGWGYPAVEPGGEACVAQIIRSAGERGLVLLVRQRHFACPVPCPPVGDSGQRATLYAPEERVGRGAAELHRARFRPPSPRRAHAGRANPVGSRTLRPTRSRAARLAQQAAHDRGRHRRSNSSQYCDSSSSRRFRPRLAINMPLIYDACCDEY